MSQLKGNPVLQKTDPVPYAMCGRMEKVKDNEADAHSSCWWDSNGKTILISKKYTC